MIYLMEGGPEEEDGGAAEIDRRLVGLFDKIRRLSHSFL